MKSSPAHTLIFFAFSSILAAASAPESRRVDIPKAETTRAVVSQGDYVLQPLDLLKVLVFQEDDINKQGEVRMSEQATIALPLIGTVSLKGKTVRQAESLIRDLYDKDYLVNPQVSVNVIKYAERFVNVSGAVNQAGRVPFPPERGLTIISAITAAGGHSRLAKLTKVRLTRTGADGTPETREIDVEAIMKGQADNVPLENNDTVVVPERVI